MLKTLTNIWLTALEPSETDDSDVYSSDTIDTLSVPVPDDFFKQPLINLQPNLPKYVFNQSASAGGNTLKNESVIVPFGILQTGNRLMKCCCIAVISDCVDQLSLISGVYSSLVDCVEMRDVIYKTLEERYRLDKRDVCDEYVINASYTDLHKLLKEVKTLIYVLKEVGQEISVFGGIGSLELYIESVDKMKRDEEDLFEDVRHKESIFKNLDSAYKNCRVEHAKNCEELDLLAREFVRGFKDELEYAHAERSFTKRWEEARREQNTMVLRNNEGYYKKTIEKMQENTDNEIRCHTEIQTFLQVSTKEYTDEIERWMEMYDKVTDERDMDIYRMKNKIEKIKEDREQLQLKYESRANEMEAYIEHKRKKREKEERLALETQAARKIQAWWRLTMFRKKLGPYKKKKDKSKNKKKGSGKRRK